MNLSAISKFFSKKLEEIQGSDDATKKRWLIFFSSITMVVVVSLWIFYMNLVVTSFDTQEERVATVAVERRSFSELASTALYNARNALSRIFATFGASNRIEIKKEDFNFIPD